MSDDEQPTVADVEKVAYRLLARRDHAHGELVRKLRRRDFPDELIEQVVDDCVDSGYVDDRRFAREQGRMLVRKCWGPHQIRKKLRARGVDDTIIDDAIEQLGEKFDFKAQAKQRLESKFGDPAGLDDRDQQRAYRHLIHRGYPADLIRRLLFDC